MSCKHLVLQLQAILDIPGCNPSVSEEGNRGSAIYLERRSAVSALSDFTTKLFDLLDVAVHPLDRLIELQSEEFDLARFLNRTIVLPLQDFDLGAEWVDPIPAFLQGDDD
jgi:hypothetical protein